MNLFKTIQSTLVEIQIPPSCDYTTFAPYFVHINSTEFTLKSISSKPGRIIVQINHYVRKSRKVERLTDLINQPFRSAVHGALLWILKNLCVYVSQYVRCRMTTIHWLCNVFKTLLSYKPAVVPGNSRSLIACSL